MSASVPVLVGAPVARRRLWLCVVTRCPWCSRVHAHRSGPGALFGGQAERECPVTGRSYLLAPAAKEGAA